MNHLTESSAQADALEGSRYEALLASANARADDAEQARDDYAKAFLIARASGDRKAIDALTALTEALGTFNAENPWLGVTASVALLQLDKEKAERERAVAREALRQIYQCRLTNGNGGICRACWLQAGRLK